MGHVSVLLSEVIQALNLSEGMMIIDATFGGGGHSRAILEKIGLQGKLIAMDCDQKAISRGQQEFGERVEFHHGNFSGLSKALDGRVGFDGVLADLGISSFQLEDMSYGISFESKAPLDMRFSVGKKSLAEKLLKTDEKELARVLKIFGDVKSAYRVAREVLKAFSAGDLVHTGDLADLVRKNQPKGKVDPATKVFMALRMWVNEELKSIDLFLPQAFEALKPGGRMAVISFHSKEDALVKSWANSLSQGEEDPVYGGRAPGRLKWLVKKPITPSEKELGENPRSRSAKLRVIEKLG